MKKGNARWLAAVLVTAILSGCGAAGSPAQTGDSTAAAGDGEGKPYKFALVCPLTGDSAQYGMAYKNACEILVEQVNAAGGLDGGQVVLEVYDDKKDPKETVNIANLLVSDPDILGIVGSQTSSCSMAAAPVFQKAGLTMISPSSSHPDFTSIGNYIFRTTLTQAYESAQYADFVVTKQAKKNIAIIYSNDDWGVSVKDIFTARATELGANIVATETFISGQTKDFTPLISKVKQSGPDAVFLVSLYSETAQILQQCKSLDLSSTFIGTSALLKQEFIDLAGENANGLLLLNSFLPENTDPNYLAVQEEYVKRTGSQVDAYVTQSYDALDLMIGAARKVGRDREKIRDEVANISDYHGLSGVFHFDENRDPQKELFAFQIENGKFVNIDV